MKQFILKEESIYYYVAEGVRSIHREKAATFESLEDLFTKVPIMRMWNWDYKVFEIKDKEELIDESEWKIIYNKMKSENRIYENLNEVIPQWITRSI